MKIQVLNLETYAQNSGWKFMIYNSASDNELGTNDGQMSQSLSVEKMKNPHIVPLPHRQELVSISRW